MLTSKEQQLNDRINSLKKLMNQALNTSGDASSTNLHDNSNNTGHSLLDPSTPKLLYNSTQRTYSSDGVQRKLPVFNSGSLLSKNYALFDSDVTDNEEIKYLKDQNRTLEDMVSSYAMKVQIANDENRELEQKLKSCRVELDQEVDKRRTNERALKEQLNQVQQQVEELHSQIDLQKQREKSLSESRRTLEVINSELEKSNAEKGSTISELQRQLNQGRNVKDELEATITKLQSEIKHLEDDIALKNQSHESKVSDMQEEVWKMNEKYSAKMKKVLKETEREKIKYEQTLSHFKEQINNLESQSHILNQRLSEMQNENAKLLHQIQGNNQRERLLGEKLESTLDLFNELKTRHALVQQSYQQLSKERDQLAANEKKIRVEIEEMQQKHKVSLEEMKKDLQNSEKNVSYQSLQIQQQVQQIQLLENKIEVLEQEKTELLELLRREKETRDDEVDQIVMLMEKIKLQKHMDEEKTVSEITTLKNQIVAMEKEKSDIQEVYQKQIDVLQQQIAYNREYEEALNSQQEQTDAQLAQLMTKLRKIEQENEILIKKNNSQQRRQGLHEKLREQNNILRESVELLKRERDSLLKKLQLSLMENDLPNSNGNIESHRDLPDFDFSPNSVPMKESSPKGLPMTPSLSGISPIEKSKKSSSE